MEDLLAHLATQGRDVGTGCALRSTSCSEAWTKSRLPALFTRSQSLLQLRGQLGLESHKQPTIYRLCCHLHRMW